MPEQVPPIEGPYLTWGKFDQEIVKLEYSADGDVKGITTLAVVKRPRNTDGYSLEERRATGKLLASAPELAERLERAEARVAELEKVAEQVFAIGLDLMANAYIGFEESDGFSIVADQKSYPELTTFLRERKARAATPEGEGGANRG